MHAGAGRIELCSSPADGGVTPSAGIVSYALQHITIPVFPMVRPRGGNFIYNADELAIMKQDILMFKQMGCPGIATGIQLSDNKIDTENLKRLVEWAYPMQVTCHKVFDRTPDAFQALEDVITTGCTRILTSGLHKTATEGAAILNTLVKQAGSRIAIMPGGGVRSSNIGTLVADTGAKEYHSSGIININISQYADHDEVLSMVNTLNKYQSKYN
jgi:copper homeostasis protein